MLQICRQDMRLTLLGHCSVAPDVPRCVALGLVPRRSPGIIPCNRPCKYQSTASLDRTTRAPCLTMATVKGAVAITDQDIEKLCLRLHEIQAVKFGDFKLKSGIQSPLYVDLRAIISYPALMHQVSELMFAKVAELQFDCLCGVPYTALPIATAMSLQHGKPMLMRRKEVKEYGTKKAIEGRITAGETCLIVEDLVTSGASIMETVGPLQAEGLKVQDVVVLIDREQGGAARMATNGLKLHAAFPITFLLDVLVQHGDVKPALADKVRSWLAANQTFPDSSSASSTATAQAPKASRFPFDQRATLAQNPTGKKLFEIMARKQSNLAVAADVPTVQQLFQLAEQVGPHICCLKTHVDIFDTWDPSTAAQLRQLADKHDFLIFEDRKFADIGNTVVSQYGGGIYRMSEWSDLVNAHMVPGPGIIQGLKQVGLSKGRGLLLLAEMSSKGHLATGSYTEAVAAAAEENQDFVMGFISQTPAHWSKPSSPGLVHMTPGVQLATGGDDLGQQYNTPNKAINESGSDVIIVGRGIYKASDPANAAKEYKAAGWAAYLQSIGAQ